MDKGIAEVEAKAGRRRGRGADDDVEGQGQVDDVDEERGHVDKGQGIAQETWVVSPAD